VRRRESEITAHLNALGFADVVLDPEGYRPVNLHSLFANT